MFSVSTLPYLHLGGVFRAARRDMIRFSEKINNTPLTLEGSQSNLEKSGPNSKHAFWNIIFCGVCEPWVSKTKVFIAVMYVTELILVVTC